LIIFLPDSPAAHSATTDAARDVALCDVEPSVAADSECHEHSEEALLMLAICAAPPPSFS
jgi:hypothetical protein